MVASTSAIGLSPYEDDESFEGLTPAARCWCLFASRAQVGTTTCSSAEKVAAAKA